MPTIKKSIKGNKTRKIGRGKSLQSFEKEIVLKFLEMSNTVKLYHWKTYSYAGHKATDELYGKIGENMDTFVEVLLGKTGDRVHLEGVKKIPLYDYSNVKDFKKKIEEYKSYLVGLDNKPTLKTMSNSDLFNIRDELLANLNQFLYLLTFK
jgi:hypothetical protein